MADLASNQSSTSILTKAEYIKKHQQKTYLPSNGFEKNDTDSILTYQSSVLLREKSQNQINPYLQSGFYQNQKEGFKNNKENSTIIDQTINTQFFGLLTEEKLRIQSILSLDEKRDLVVNWIALIHTKYWFQQQTFHLAVSILDKYIRKMPDSKDDFQLLAITSFWIASKVEERKIKELKVWMKLGKGFEKDQIIQMEAKILEVLQYQITEPTSQVLLWQLIQNCTNLTEKQIHLCLYILQLSLLDVQFKKFQSGIIALSTIYLCLKIEGIEEENSDIHNVFLLHWNDVRKCSRRLCKTLQKEQGNMKSPIVRKFASRKLNRVSNISFGRKSDSQMSLGTTFVCDFSKN